MSLDLIKKYIKCGMFQEARKLIEKESNVSNLMADAGGGGSGGGGTARSATGSRSISDYEDSKVFEKVPLLVMLSVVRDEDVAINLSRLLLEKGYALDLRDKNGLCALNYAIALKRLRLLNVYMDTFNFELNKFKDCYRNTFLHYAFAINDTNIVDLFSKIYSKYYEWDPNTFKFIANCDGLTVQDLYDYMIFLNKNSKEKLSKRTPTSYKDLIVNNRNPSIDSSSRNDITSNAKFTYPESFKFDSNPILICKFINQVFHSCSTLKSNLICMLNNPNEFENLIKKSDNDSNNSPLIARRAVKTASSSNCNREFKMNILNQIKCVNKISTMKPTTKSKLLNEHENTMLKKTELISRSLTSLTSSNDKNKNLPKIIESRYANYYKNLASTSNKINFGPLMITQSRNKSLASGGPGGETWRSEFRSIFNVYSLISSPSYRPSSISTYQYNNDSVLELLGELSANVRRSSINNNYQPNSLNRQNLTPSLSSPTNNHYYTHKDNNYQQLASITSKEHLRSSSSPTTDYESNNNHAKHSKKSIDSTSSTVILTSSTPIISTYYPNTNTGNGTITSNNLAISIDRKPSMTFNDEPKLEMYLVPGSLLNRGKQRRSSDAKKV